MTAETIRAIFRAAHIIGGTLVFVAGIAVLCMEKGRSRHVALGRLFMWTGRLTIFSAMTSVVWGLIHLESFIGDVTAAELEEIRSFFPSFLGVLGVLGILVLFEMERGLLAIRQPGRASRKVPALVALAGVNALAGVALCFWGLSLFLDGERAWSFIAIIVGLIGSDPIRTLLKEQEGATMTHAIAMLESLSGFVAAFALLGAARIVQVDLFRGGPGVVIVVAIISVVFSLLKKYWRRRIDGRQPFKVGDLASTPT